MSIRTALLRVSESTEEAGGSLCVGQRLHCEQQDALPRYRSAPLRCSSPSAQAAGTERTLSPSWPCGW
eukprot:760921-Hanusia_phi.AAC.3